MNKTPVSILQEMMVRENVVPNYELVHNGGGTHMNTFIYQVTCGTFTARGTGRSKKDAKHKAAEAMLEVIVEHRGYPQLPPPETQVHVRTPLPPPIPEIQRVPPNEPFVNAVGILQSLCLQNNLKDPEYVLISAVGPSHAKVFTIQCRVVTFQEIGIATTKKQAKQEAAKKLLDKLTIIPDFNEQIPNSNPNIDIADAVKDAAKVLSQRKTFNVPTIKNKLGIQIANYHLQLIDNIDIETRKDLILKLKSLTSVSEAGRLLDEFKDTVSDIGMDVSITNLITISAEKHAVCVKAIYVNCYTEIGIGDTNVEATIFALQKMIKCLLALME